MSGVASMASQDGVESRGGRMSGVKMLGAARTLRAARSVAAGLGLTLGLASGVVGLAQASVAQPSGRELARAVTQYLADHGDLCVGKYQWPRDVTPEDEAAHSNDAVQLPVLERLGLVESTEIAAPGATVSSAAPDAASKAGSAGSDAAGSEPPVDGARAAVKKVRRYSLTAKGRGYYLEKKRVTLGAHDQLVEHDRDLCVARLSLDKVVKSTAPDEVRGHRKMLVQYTYHVKPAEWMADPQAREVFPVADKIIRGEGNLLMSVTVEQHGEKWVPVLPGQ